MQILLLLRRRVIKASGVGRRVRGLNSLMDLKSAGVGDDFVNVFSCSSWLSCVLVLSFSRAIAVMLLAPKVNRSSFSINM